MTTTKKLKVICATLGLIFGLALGVGLLITETATVAHGFPPPDFDYPPTLAHGFPPPDFDYPPTILAHGFPPPDFDYPPDVAA